MNIFYHFPGGLFGPKIQGLRNEDDDEEQSIQNNERQGLLESTTSIQSEHSDVAVVVPQTVCFVRSSEQFLHVMCSEERC